MSSRADTHVYVNPLAPPSSRFALGPLGGLPRNADPSSTTRPFALRFARPLPDSDTPSWPRHRYCHDRQMLVTIDEQAVPLVDSCLGWDSTTLYNKDGKDGPQEDWKPDLPFSAAS
jgi:putative ATP-grasp target RiPP